MTVDAAVWVNAGTQPASASIIANDVRWRSDAQIGADGASARTATVQ